MNSSNTVSLTRRAGIDISVIVPIERRHVEIAALHAEYRAALQKTGRNVEFIYVIDGKFDDASAAVAQLVAAGEPVIGVHLSRNFGESTALMAGFEQASGEVILTMPAYRQIEADDMAKLLAGLDSADIVVSYRWPRVGGLGERIRRGLFHKLVNSITRQDLHDLGCSARALKRQVLEEIVLYGDQHRLLPALADRQGFRTAEVQVRQSPQDRYEGGYATKEYLHRLLDIFAVFFLVRFTKKPLRFFGMVGATILAVGTLAVLVLVIQRMFFDMGLANRPALLLSSLLVVLGLQLFALGLLGELIIFTHAGGLKDYQVDKVIEYPRPAA
jgi:glycosyltransferase involved in cell wall biosynthesis